MTLPIDPERLTAEDIGEERATLAMEHEESVEFVRECCLEAGFGIPVEFSPSDLLNEKVDADRDPHYALGACNPEMADWALDASEKRIGGHHGPPRGRTQPLRGRLRAPKRLADGVELEVSQL